MTRLRYKNVLSCVRTLSQMFPTMFRLFNPQLFSIATCEMGKQNITPWIFIGRVGCLMVYT